jgi:hypothetical protein
VQVQVQAQGEGEGEGEVQKQGRKLVVVQVPGKAEAVQEQVHRAQVARHHNFVAWQNCWEQQTQW